LTLKTHPLESNSAGPSSNTWFVWPVPAKTQTASRSVQPLLHRWPQSVPVLYDGTPLTPSKLSLPIGGSGPHLIHGFLGPPESSVQTASRSAQPFLSGSLVWQTDRHTMLLDR